MLCIDLLSFTLVTTLPCVGLTLELTVSYSFVCVPALGKFPVTFSLGRCTVGPVPEGSTWWVLVEFGGEESTSLKYDSAVCLVLSFQVRADVENVRLWKVS